MGSLSKKLFGMSLLVVALGLTQAAEAQTTVSIDQAPARVQPGETFEVVWTVNTPNPIMLTTVVWGEQPRQWNKIGSLRSGASGTFRTMLTAPNTQGAMHYVIYVRADPVRGVTAERTIQVANGTVTPTPPAAPTALTADANSPTEVELNWSDNANDETGFVVQRSTSGGAFMTIAQLGANAASYTDNGLTASTDYAYRVFATNNAGSSGNSNTANVRTPDVTPPPAPPASASGLTANASGANQVDLSWTDNSNNETAFLIGRRTGTSGNFAQIGQVGADVTTYSDTTAQPGTTYDYSVFATNAVGNAAGSNVARATTPSSQNTVTATKDENPNLAIPDANAQGAVSNLNVTGTGSIQSMTVEVDITHTWRGDLVLQLTSPAGTTITLFDVADNDGNDDVVGTFPTTITPNETLNRFNGEEINGVWSLRVIDTQGQDTGTINDWTITADVGASTGAQFGLTRRVPVTGLTFPITGATTPTSLQRVRAFPNLSFSSPILLTHAGDGTDRIFVVEQGGRVRVFPNQQNVSSASTFLDIRSRVTAGGEQGLLGMAFDPNYAQNRTFYVYYSRSNPRRSVIERYRASASNPNVADTSSRQLVMEIAQPYSNHNGGMIAFGPDGYLYIGMGDGGSGGDPQGHGQNINTLLGAILRIDVRNQTTYRVPSDNPLVGRSGRDEIYAWGIRNPWRFSFDRTTGDLWVGDVGQNAVEEIDIVRKGGNYGWNAREGDRPYTGASGNFDEPVYAYAQTLGRSVTGGYVYHGSRVPGMQGIYIYGDYTSGRVWQLKYRNGQVEFNRQVSSVTQLCSFGEDESGELYAVSHSGQLYMFSPPGGSTTQFPQTLAATGLFQSVANLTPAAGVIEYDLKAPLWSDNALKRRWIALPGNSRITFSADGNWQFPVGTVLVKHFELEMTVGNPATARRLETRVLIHEQAGWAGYTYRWNNAGTQANLISTGEFETYQVNDGGQVRNQEWYFPSRVDCMNCHTQAAGFVLGPRTGQINSDFDYPTMTDNQLRSWNHIGLFDQNIGAHTQYAEYADPSDTSATLSDRARSYLASNCANCHLPGGPTPHQIDLRREATRAQMNSINVVPNGGDLGVTGARIITPGNKDASVLYLRMNRRNFQGMPTIGSALVHPEGVDLIGQWIDAGAN